MIKTAQNFKTDHEGALRQIRDILRSKNLIDLEIDFLDGEARTGIESTTIIGQSESTLYTRNRVDEYETLTLEDLHMEELIGLLEKVEHLGR